MVEAKLRVIYGDTDQMGVVYYANYLRYFEFARGEFFRAMGGGSYQALEDEGKFLPVVEVSCTYKAAARYDDVLLIRAEAEARRASLTFTYEIRRQGEDRVLCTGKTIHACIGREGKPERLPESVARAIERGRASERGD